jgi:ABC-type glycerol-3-phosphate transport system permease component
MENTNLQNSPVKLPKKVKDSGKRESFNALTIIMLVVLVIYVASLIGLLFWALLTSFKSHADFRLNKFGLPKEWVWNYGEVFNRFVVRVNTDAGRVTVSMGMMFVYALVYAVGCSFFNTLVPCITAYLCARFPFKFSKVIHTVVIIVMILPIIGSLPSEIQMSKTFGLYDQLWGLWIMKAHFLGMYFLVMYGNFKSLPMAYTEAAKIDGAGNMNVLIRVILPLIKNTFFTIMLINFIGFWNDYQTPLIYMPSYPTIALGMFEMANTRENGMSRVNMRMAGSMLMLIPILSLFLAFHKRLLGNLTVGGLKG